MKDQIEIIAIDADDTLWVNETYFRETEKEFCQLLSSYASQEEIASQLFKTEIKNLHLYGYGIKGFMLSMIETLNRITQHQASTQLVSRVLELGQNLIMQPVELIEGVEFTLQQLSQDYRLVLATKGDLLDQERKLERSNLGRYFHHIEVMSDKKPVNYQSLLRQLGLNAENFLMIGNSVRSDILPVLELNAYAAHVPFHTTWEHEVHPEKVVHDRLIELEKINDILTHLQ